jgi:uncharacterized BrkB/YihY/UPF0761 family membrane protein
MLTSRIAMSCRDLPADSGRTAGHRKRSFRCTVKAVRSSGVHGPSPLTERYHNVRDQVSERARAIENRPLLGFPLASYRRFKEIDGKQLAFVIAGNMFISVIPLFIIGYAIISAFDPDKTVAAIVVERFDLHGDTAKLVHETFANARSGRNVALSLSATSLFVTGFSVATAMQTAFARAFRVPPMRGFPKFVRGAAWLALMLANLGLSLTLRYWAKGESWWFVLLLIPLLLAVNFGFYLLSPRLLLDLPFEWRHLVPGAAICVLTYAVVGLVSSFLMRNWLSAYGHAYGGFGIALAFLSWIGILATFWVWIGAIAAIYWERFATVGEIAEINEEVEEER